ncbi:MAG: LuxR C-terminal-related transcriptional regulator, partial [Bacteroidetes bacterium]|nr:LuxR C-terminal-related transcriptional regulator [Bacteroidota bacterium]
FGKGEVKMTTQEFGTLKSYARLFAHTEDDSDELLLLAYQESLRLGSKCTLALLINYMRLCAKSIFDRSILALDEAGKSRLDAFNKGKLYLSDPIADDTTLEGIITADSADPFDDYVSQEFVCSLNDRERQLLSELTAGYSVREICKDLGISSKTFEKVRASLRSKVRSYL